MTKTVPDTLREAAEIYQQRAAMYGDNYLMHGYVMQGLFPNGITLQTVDDFNRYGIFVQMVSKLSRYANMFTRGGHYDSLDDNTVYSQMLREIDGLIADRVNAVPQEKRK